MIDRAVCALAIATSCFALSASASTQADLLADLQKLAELVPGVYDNRRQVDAQSNMGVTEHARLQHQTMVWARVERPRDCCPGEFAGPDAVFFYVQTYRNGALWLLGERLVAVYPDPVEGALRWQNMKISSPERWVGLHLDTSKQTAVTLMPPRTDIDCKVLWRRVGERHFRGGVKGGGCQLISEYTGNPRRIEMEFQLTADWFSFMDRGLEQGVVVYGSPSATPHSLRRIE